MAETFLINKEQECGVRDKYEKGHLKSVRLCENEDGVIVVGGRVPNSSGQGSLPVLARGSYLAQLYAQKAHREAHTGVSSTTAKMRSKFWVIGERRVAEKEKHQCVPCRKADKVLCQQQMAPLPTHRVTPARPFLTTSLDLAGPFLVKDQVKKIVQVKVWIVLFTCTATRAIDLKVAPGYDEDSFVQSLRKFMNRRGAPQEIISDQGTQLISASKDVAETVKPWNWNRIQEVTTPESTCGPTWTFVPKEGQHQNGVAESLIKVTKEALKHFMGDASLTFSEFQLACSEVTYIINNRPLGVLPSSDDEVLEPLTPNQLLLGQFGRDLPPADADQGRQGLLVRYKYVQTLLDDWWKR